MNLQEIKETECKECGSNTVSESQKDKHTNGHFNEYRAFSCGRSLTFFPNFMETRERGHCKFDKNEIEKQTKRKASKVLLEAYIDELDVDNDFKDSLQSSFKYI